MMTKEVIKIIIFKQQMYIEEVLLKKGLSSNSMNKDLFLFSKYYLNKNKSDNEILTILRNEVNKILPDGALQKAIDFIFKKAKKLSSYSLENEIMYITKNEIDTILNFTDKIKEQKIIFSMLVIYKFIGYDYYNFINSDIFKYTKLKRNDYMLDDLFYKMNMKGLINGYENHITHERLRKLNFAELYNESDIIIIITNLDENFIYYFDQYVLNQKISNCKNCNTLIQIKSNHQKYCDKCWKEEHKIQDREYQKRKYHSRLLETNPKPT